MGRSCWPWVWVSLLACAPSACSSHREARSSSVPVSVKDASSVVKPQAPPSTPVAQSPAPVAAAPDAALAKPDPTNHLPGVMTSDIPCTTVDDCWATDGRPSAPMARPRRLRSKKFRVCHDGEGEPVCHQSRCGLVFYDC